MVRSNILKPNQTLFRGLKEIRKKKSLFLVALPLRGGWGVGKGLAIMKKTIFLKLYLSYFKTKKKFLLPLSSRGDYRDPGLGSHPNLDPSYKHACNSIWI